MSSFKHAYMVLATDFELEPVIEQYLSTYPDAQPRKYNVVCRLENERHEGDFCYVVVFEHVTSSVRPSLGDFIKSYCEVHDKVAAVQTMGSVFPELAKANNGNAEKYRAK